MIDATYAALEALNIPMPDKEIQQEIIGAVKQQFAALTSKKANYDEWQAMFHALERQYPRHLPFLNYCLVYYCGYGKAAQDIVRQSPFM